MDNYVNVSINCTPFLSKELDLRVPTDLTVKELVGIISDSYGLAIPIVNPCLRNKQTGAVLASTIRLDVIKDGTLLQLENIS